jgi:hypothetical protein
MARVELPVAPARRWWLLLATVLLAALAPGLLLRTIQGAPPSPEPAAGDATADEVPVEAPSMAELYPPLSLREEPPAPGDGGRIWLPAFEPPPAGPEPPSDPARRWEEEAPARAALALRSIALLRREEEASRADEAAAAARRAAAVYLVRSPRPLSEHAPRARRSDLLAPGRPWPPPASGPVDTTRPRLHPRRERAPSCGS